MKILAAALLTVVVLGVAVAALLMRVPAGVSPAPETFERGTEEPLRETIHLTR